jgi:uncharacterized repeat protein (TIGR01451 family)
MTRRGWRVLSAVVLSLATVWAAGGPAAAVTVPAPVGDAPVFIPGTEYPDTGRDDGSNLLAVNDDYILSRTAGDNQLSVETAAASRAAGADRAGQIRKGLQGSASATAPFNSAWAAIGPSPIIQVQRSDGALADVAGRIGALAIRRNGRFILGAAQGGIWTMDPGTGIWVPRTDTLSSLATGALAVAPSNDMIVYDGTGEGALSGDSYFGNGILKSTDGGTTWSHVSGDFFTGVSTARLAVDATNADHLYAAILRGRGGAHRTSPPVHSTFGLWESTDGAVTWHLLMAAPGSSLGATDVRIDPITPNVLYASFLGDKIYKSTDGGATWNAIMTGLPAEADFSAGPTRFAIGLSHPAGQSPVLYVGFDFINGPSAPPSVGGPGAHRVARVFKSTDAGASWFPVQRVGGLNGVADYCGTQCTYDNVIETDPANPNVVFAAGSFGYSLSPPSGGIFRSDDGGSSWKNLGWDQHPDFHSVVFDPNNSQNILIGSDGGVWYSQHQGGRVPGTPGATQLDAVDWIDLNGNPNVDPAVDPANTSNGLQISQFSSIQANPTRTPRFWGGTQDNGTLRKLAGLPAWYDVTSGDGGNAQVDPTDWHFVYGTYFAPPTQIYRMTDGGASFFQNKPITNGINVNDRAEFYMPLVLNQENPNQLFTGTYRVYRTDNAKEPSAGDVHWSLISSDLTSGCTGPAPNGARNCTITSIGVGGGAGVYVGTNDGLLWVSPNGQTSGTPTWIQIGHSGQNGTNDGTHNDVFLPQRPVSGIAVDRSNWRIAYVAYNGFDAATPNRPGHVFKTTNGGQTFQNITGNLPDTPVNWLIQDPAFQDTIYAATDVGPFVTYNGGKNWFALGSGFPIVGVDQISLDTFHRVLAAGTHGRGAWSLNDGSAPAPALVLSVVDAGVPVGPGSLLDYTLTVSNIGNAAATGVHLTDPLPANTSFVSADNGGVLDNGAVSWNGLTVPTGIPAGNGTGVPTAGGGKLVLHLRVQIDPNLSSSVTSIVNDGTRLNYRETTAPLTGSPTVTPIAPAFAVSISPSAQTGGARTGSSQTYTETVQNLGFKTDHYNLSSTGGSFPVTFYNSTCATQITATPDLVAGATVDVCVRVTPPTTASDGTSSTSSVTAASASSTDSASASITTIAVTVDTLLVDEDGNAPDTNSYYDNALTAAGVAHDTWDLKVNASLPVKYMEAFKNIVWFTGTSFPGPILPYEKSLTAYLNGGGHLMLSGEDLLDQAAGTTDFVRNYLHVDWDGSERQNDKPTNAFHGVSGTLTDGIGAVNRDPVLGAPFMDEITPNGGAVGIFTDDAGQTDGLSFSGTYKVVFLPFGFEEYGTAAQKADFVTRVFTFFGS